MTQGTIPAKPWKAAISVRAMQPKKTSSDKIRPFLVMSRSWRAGPMRKSVQAIALRLPSV